jgi:hypothetical protein
MVAHVGAVVGAWVGADVASVAGVGVAVGAWVGADVASVAGVGVAVVGAARQRQSYGATAPVEA